MKTKIIIVITSVVIFVFRLLMGLSKFYSDDELQIYLIGLKSYTTKTFPYYGPDVVYTQTQIPGGLQGLLISEPLKILPIPESPFILLNFLSFSALIFFGWYLSKRIPNVPKWFIYIWLLTCPWTVQYSTHIENPSYVLFGAILFFISVFELGHFYKHNIINKNLAFFFLGFSVFWIMQLHMSWVLTMPFLLWMFIINRKNIKLLLKGALFFFIGSSLSISTLIPTLLLKTANVGGVEQNIVLNTSNLLEIPNIFLRFLSLASYEVPKYLGTSVESRIGFLINNIWIAPLIIFILLIGFFQVAYFVMSYFKTNELKEWHKVKKFSLLSFVLLCFSFLFSISKPKAYTFYIFFPIIMWYSMYCYNNLFKKNIKIITIIFLVSGIIFQLSLFNNRYSKDSLFAHRKKISKAITQLDYTILNVRRDSYCINANIEDVWKKKNNIRYTGFEYKNPYFRPQNIVETNKFEGKYSCKIDPIQPFSVSFNESFSALNKPKKLKISFMAKSNDFSQFLLTYRTKSSNSEKTDYQEIKSPVNDNWVFFEFEYNIPTSLSNKIDLSIFFWMNKKSENQLFIDNIKLIFYK